MKKKLYQEILSVITNFKGLSRECLVLLQNKYPDINNDTLASIVSFIYQRRMKCNYSKSPMAEERIYNTFMESVSHGEEPGIILRLAVQCDVTPYLLAKLILQRHYKSIDNEEGNTCNIVKKYMKDTTLIDNMDLAYEVYLATIYDDLYGPISEVMKSSLGQQYEIQLYRQITELGLTYKDEEDLRKCGYDKTPDVKLEIPIAVDGFIIHWIESKALFADEDTHKEYMKHQYCSYWNRFGPGLVIYWFGYVDVISNVNDKRFIVRDHLPTNIVKIDVNRCKIK